MYLRQIKLINFKNFESQKFEFSPNINCIVGNNGVGKTNILDAIYYLSHCRSYFNKKDLINIRFNEEFFSIEGNYQREEEQELIFCAYKQNEQKIVKKNAKVYKKLSLHVGQFPTVIISPYDRDLIVEGSDVRRKFMDIIISQSNTTYLQSIIRYNKILTQRNLLLKFYHSNGNFDKNALYIYDYELILLGQKIHTVRKQFISDFIPIFLAYYQELSSGNEEVSIQYESQLNENVISDLFEKNIEKDRQAQYTTCGIHKDDLLFLLNQNSIKSIGSQGQQKTFVIALKISQFQYIKKQSNQTPIMLLDDIFDKLDEHRVEKLIKLVNENGQFGQIFITDTHAQRTKEIVAKINQNHCFIEL
jgi:DNA replication and repair protein RecF